MATLTASVLIPSFGRPGSLERCLISLAGQTRQPDEVIVVWQGNDAETRHMVEKIEHQLPYPVRLVHLPEPGIVPAENKALAVAIGQIVVLIDDDAVARPEWLARHLSWYDDLTVGAVGGPAVNYDPAGRPFPKRAVEPVGALTWYGRAIGNLYDHVPEWSDRPPQEVMHLVGYNMSLRRIAFSSFDAGLRPYWQGFELEACLQVRAAGYRAIADFANVVEHYPTNTAYVAGRDGDLALKVYNAAFNHSYVLAKHSAWFLRPWRLMYLLSVGSVGTPGLVAFFVAVGRHGHPIREAILLAKVWWHTLAGWRAGTRARTGTL